ncbi:bacteriorhodopsin [Halopiger xanaduensis]|uniref:Rhodopsin n=1 Tax=Halopiger xanaduensis (strain DSM 18323 / JCM 14033 / SH-6) TaxID=797210 RepID=F8DBF0_HALXS|nr:bacteriorhodopsin [Halopiger xanaduensis]AEH37065.1 rhodopsin [Halopiger xanaduensis SH-6]
MIEPTLVFWLGALGMAAGTVAFAWGGRSAAAESRQYYTVLGAISLIATAAYVTMAMGYGWLSVDGRTVFAPRYVDWILTTPLLLLYLGWLADINRSRLGLVVGVNTLVMAGGFAGALLTGPVRFALFGVAAVAYVGLLYLILQPMTARANEQADAIRSLFTGLRNLTVILWSVYPVIWLLGTAGFGLLTLPVDVMLTTYLDLLTKVGFGLIALNAGAALEAEYGASIADNEPTDDADAAAPSA